jgi:hypothetical protein
VVKVYLPKEFEPAFVILEKRLGMKKSEVLRIAFMDYMKDLDLLSDLAHGKKGVVKERK